uniref:Hydrophobic seed protein domain-containing protein n=1 Tax=Oryza punctata TaxID=4537 RepID=A0A0E0MMA4_ORYPU
MTVEPTPAPVVAPSQPPIVAPAQPPIVAPTPSASNQCPRENVIALNLCTRLDLSTLLNNPTKAMQDCCPPLNSLSSTLATGCLCEVVKINLRVTADVLFLKTVLREFRRTGARELVGPWAAVEEVGKVGGAGVGGAVGGSGWAHAWPCAAVEEVGRAVSWQVAASTSAAASLQAVDAMEDGGDLSVDGQSSTRKRRSSGGGSVGSSDPRGGAVTAYESRQKTSSVAAAAP